MLILAAFATGLTAFDFSLDMRIRTRDALFATHRLSGILAGGFLLVWGLIRIRGLVQQRGFIGRIPATGIFHTLLGMTCLVLPVLPWIARSLDGRSHELYAIWPVFNLVSHPTTPLAYKLLHQHKVLVDAVLILLGLHIAGALFHRLVMKDKTLWKMSFGKE